MDASDDRYVFAWSSAIIRAEDKLSLDQVVECLRNEKIPFTMLERRMLADLLVPNSKGAKVEAVLRMPRGRPNHDLRNYDFYNAVEDYKHHHKLQEVSRETKMKIGKQFRLLSFEACQSALRRGRKISEAIASANDK